MTDGAIRVRWAGGDRTFEPGSDVRIGRDSTCEVVTENPNVSRHHADLRHDSEGWVVTDNGSTQGIHVGNARVDRVRIVGRSEIVLGRPGVGERLELLASNGTHDDAATEMPDDSEPDDVGGERPGGNLRSEMLAGGTVVTGQQLNVECAGRSYSFQPGADVIIGRDPGCDVVTPNPTVSRRHAALSHDGSGWRLKDLGSNSGTFLDGRRITETSLNGSMAVWLGDPDSGDRVVLVAGGTRQRSATQKLDRVARSGRGLLIVAAVTLLTLVVAAVAVLNRGGGAPDNDKLARATVRILVDDGSGSGSIIDADQGLILTNAHVAAPRSPGQGVLYGDSEADLPEDPAEVEIAVAPGLDRAAEIRYRGSVVAADGYLDFAIVRITKNASGALVEPADLEGLSEIELGSSDSIKTGDGVRVVGYPSIVESASPNLTRGVISSNVQDDRLSSNRAFLNVDADINPGNSGGIAVDDAGLLVGVPTSTRFRSSTGSKANRLRPVNLAKPLIEAAQTRRPYTSPFVTPLPAGAAIGSVSGTSASTAQQFGHTCDGAARAPQRGDAYVALRFDYRGLGAVEHQDVRVDVVDQQAAKGSELIGQAVTQDQFPFAFTDAGCATVTVALDQTTLAPGRYRLDFFLGPNYRPAGSVSLACPSASPAPGNPASATTACSLGRT